MSVHVETILRGGQKPLLRPRKTQVIKTSKLHDTIIVARHVTVINEDMIEVHYT